MRRANLLGQPLPGQHTAVLLDAIEISGPWLTDVKAALVLGLSQSAEPGQRVSLLYSRDGNATVMDASPFTPAGARLSGLSRFFNGVDAAGRGGLTASLTAAVETGATDLVFITSRASGWAGYLSRLEQMLTAQQRVRLHVIQIGDTNDDLRAFVRGANGGTYTNLTAEQIQNWRNATR
jgi:hypothetical protein